MVSAIAGHGQRWYPAAAWLAVGVLLLAFVSSSGDDWVAPGPSPPLDRPAPAFTLTTFGGSRLGPDDLRGRPVIVNFWATWCGTCPAEAALLERVWTDYRARGVMVVGIATHEIFPAGGDVDHNPKAYARRHRLTYPVGNDRDGAITRQFQVEGMPETFFIAADGQIVRRFSGPLDEAVARQYAAELLKPA